MIFVLFLLKNIFAANFHRVLLIDKPPVDMNCLASQGAKNNGFFGTQYFYQSLSNQGQISSINEITFTGFIYFNKFNQNGGRQVIFYLVDGLFNDVETQPYVNLGLSLIYSNNQLKLQVLSGIPSQYNLVKQELVVGNQNTDKMTQQWYHFVVSVNIQTEKLQFLNLKFYHMQTNSFYNFQTPYIQNNTYFIIQLFLIILIRFYFQFSPFSRITNEQITGYDLDSRLCGYLAKFTYYAGYSTMDYEYYLDYFSEPILLVRPLPNSLASDTSVPIKIIKNINYKIEFSKIKINKQTQIIYELPQTYDNITLTFWLNTSTVDEFQILSFLESDQQSVSIGLCLDDSGNIILQSQQQYIKVGSQGKSDYNQIGLSFIRRTYTTNFDPDPQSTMVRVVQNGDDMGYYTLNSVTNYKYLLLGFVKLQNKDQQYIYLYDLRVYYGYSIHLKVTYDCFFYIERANKSPCLYCQNENNTLCTESPSPNQYNISTFQYSKCPAGYQEQVGCPQITISGCARQSGTKCTLCFIGFSLSNNQCKPQNQFIQSPQDCWYSATFCQIRNRNFQTKVCDNNLQYRSNYCIQNDTYFPGTCSHSYAVNSTFLGCFNCVLGTFNKGFLCYDSCAESISNPIAYRFSASNWCEQTCPKYYDYYRNCTIQQTIGSCVSTCSTGQPINSITCVYPKQKQKPGYTESCWFQSLSANSYVENWKRILQCDPDCKYCYHSGPYSCLSCSNSSQFFDPLLSRCVDICDTNTLLPYSDYTTMLCVGSCGNKLTTGYLCSYNCPPGFIQYTNYCVDINSKPRGTYIYQNTCLRCPDICLECDSPTQCTSCQTNYFLINGICQLTCSPLKYYQDTQTCVTDCPVGSYTYDNPNLNGYSISICFNYGCTQIWAGQQYNTFLHQSNPFQCVIQCDPGYYGSLQSSKCVPCSGSCATCSSSIACLSCIPGFFQYKTQCFQSCPTIMDYTTWQCVPSCPAGVFVLEKARACLNECGKQYLPTYNLIYQNNCYDSPPPGIGCDASNQCYICDPACITCNGPTDQNCLSCQPNTYLLGQVCGNDCGSLQYDMQTWMCSNTCSVGTFKQGQYCSFTCMTGYYQFGIACYESTPPGSYCLYSSQKLMYLCDPCYTGCASCTGNSPDQCGSCLQNYYYYQNVCYQICPQAMPVMDSFTNLCKSSCPLPNYLQDNVCQTSCTVLTYKVPGRNVCFTNGCGDGYYAKSGVPGCQICQMGCAQCKTVSTNCLSCSIDYFLTGNTCVTQCPSNTPYHNKISWKCVDKCETSAFTYINKTTSLNYCLASCPLYQYGIQCFDECPVMYYPNPKICSKCHQQCAHCTGPSPNQCTECIMGFYLDGTSCVTQCPDDKPLDLPSRTCSSDCVGYIFLEQGICLGSCPSYLYYYTLNSKKECVKKCYDGSFNKNQNCIACAPECINCYGTLNNQCTVCSQGYFLLGSKCVGTCPVTYYSNMIDFSCLEICPPELYILQQQCLQRCPNKYFNYGQYCLLQCPSYSFVRGYECIDCHPQCVQCYDSSNQDCTKCTTNFYLNQNTCSTDCPKYYDDQLNQCVDSCDQSQYLIVDTLRCVSACPSKYLVSSQNCVYQCPKGQFKQGTNCINCDSKCSECIGSSTICTACNQNFVLDISTCSQSCSDNQLYIDNINRLCQTTCPLGLYHYQPPQTSKKFCVQTCQLQYNGFCVDQCPQQYFNKAGGCQQCPFECIECTSPNNCQQCRDGYYLNTINSLSQCSAQCSPRLTDLQNMKCVDQCDSNQVQYNSDCLTSCPTSPPLLQYKQSCLNDCPNGSFRDNNQCNLCDQYCSICYGSSNNQCTGCNSGYYLDGNSCTDSCGQQELADMVNNICVLTCGPLLVQDGQTCILGCQTVQYQKKCYDECPQRTFQMGSYCIDCQMNCVECNSSGCLQCDQGYLSNYQCGTFCQLYYDDKNHKCVDQCSDTLVQLIDHCLESCPVPYYRFKTQCLLECPVSTYSDNNYQCQDCQDRCLTCDQQNNCLQCQDGYYLYLNRCVVQCPIQLQYMDTIQGVCKQQCPLNTYIYKFTCISNCDKLILNNICLDQCQDGYYQSDNVCKQCSSHCKTCTSIDICTSCKINYYLDNQQCNSSCDNIMNQLLWQCTHTCDGFLLNNICSDKCPQSLIEYQNQCLTKCPNGFYQNNQICTRCPSQCALCSDNTNCSKCSIGYYLNQNQCQQECPIGLYGDSSILQCVNTCPSGTYKHQQQCVFDCPRPYLSSNDLCQTQCNQNQYRNGWRCIDCSIECNQCKDFGNDQCINCNNGFVLDASNKCVGECPIGYYMNGSCYKCDISCQTCDKNGCLVCKGDRQLNDNNQCLCSVGYFDDNKQDLCQKCPCPECTSYYNCTKCKNNLQPPNCSCNKQLNDDYCLSCSVAQVNVYFTNSLNQIIIDFDLLISINVQNPYQLNDCTDWFENSELFGINSKCYLNWNRTQIIINLGSQATVNVNDTLKFQSNMFKYVNDEECQDFIELFIDSTVKRPSVLIQPNIEFDIMPKISICMENIIKQISINGTGNRDVKVLQWQLNYFDDEDHYLKMKDFFSFQKDSLIIPQQTLKANFTYEIIVSYINFLGQNNQYLLVINTVSTGIPFAYLNKETLSINLFIYDCITTFLDMDGPFYLNYQIYFQENLIQQQIFNSTKLEYVIPTQDLPKGIQLKININIKEQNTITYFTIPIQDFQINFTQPDRFLGSIFTLEAKANDLDINDTQIQSFGFTYEWVCVIRHTLIPCKNNENKIYVFPKNKKIKVNLDFTNVTVVFYLRVQKQNRFKISAQTLIISEINDEYQLFEKDDEIDGYVIIIQQQFKINRRTTVSLQFKEVKQSVYILQNDQIIYSKKIQTSSLRFTFSDIARSQDSIIIYLLPGQQSIRFALNQEPQILSFDIHPKQGKPLDRFNFEIKINETIEQQPYQYSLYYYLLPQILESDLSQSTNINGIPIVTNGLLNYGNFTLPCNIAGQNISILLEVKTNKGSYSIKTSEIRITQDSPSIKDLNLKILKFHEQNDSTILDLFNSVQLFKSQTQQVCLKQCSGVGTCIDKMCKCPIGYYFDDCSGTEEENQQFEQLFKSIQQQVLDYGIDFNNYDLYIRLLNYLKQFKFLQITNLDQQVILLDNLNNNIEYRLNQINNFTIGLISQNNSEYNYNQMDTKQIVNKLDLQTTINLTTIVWSYLLNNFTHYELQYKLRVLLQNTIELYLIGLLPDESANLTYDACKITINRTNTTSIILNHHNNNNQRLLMQNQQYYDIIQVVYIKNLYCNDGYFPYINQCNIVYDYQIRQMNRLQNIQLNTTINYTFNIDNTQFQLYACIQRDQDYYIWTNEYCKTAIINKTLYCNCSVLAPTTFIKDFQLIYTRQDLYHFTLPNMVIFGYLIQLLILFIIYFVTNGKNQENLKSLSILKFGHVSQLRKGRFQINSLDQENQNLQGNQQQEIKTDIYDSDFKFHLNNFHKYHYLLRTIFKPKKFLPISFRLIVIWFRWSSSLAIISLFTNQLLTFYIAVHPAFGVIALLRVACQGFEQSYKRSTFLKEYIKLFLILLTLFLILILSTILVGYQAYYMLDQTDWFLSYYISFFIDIFCVDFILFMIQKYLGFEIREQFKQKIKHIRRIQRLRESNKTNDI